MCGVVLAADDERTSKGVVVSNMPKADEALVAALEDERIRQAWLRSPEARAQREHSRKLFEDLEKGAALDLAAQTFPGALRGKVWTGLGLRGGETVDRFLGELAARIDRPGHGKAMVESTVPLRARDEKGDAAPVELALEDRGAFFESANPLVGVQFGKDPAQGVSFARTGVRVTVEGAAIDARAVVRDDRVAVADVVAHTDFWAVPTPGGFESFVVLRSVESPESVALDVDVPDGADLRALPDGGAAVERGEERLVSITAPFATDADGQVVEVGMDVADGRLLLSIPHRSVDVRYPLLIDPEFVENWDWQSPTGDCCTAGWAGITNHSGTFDWAPLDLAHRWGYALYAWTRVDGTVINANDHGGWHFNPQGQSYIYRAEMKASVDGPSACMQRGINDGYDVKSNCSPVSFNYTTSCVVSSCDPNAGGNDNWAYMRVVSTVTGARSESTKAIAGLSTAKVFYSDRDTPSFASVNTGGTGSAWARSYAGQVTGDVTDAGLGMSSVELRIAGQAVDGGGYVCDGSAHDPCPSAIGTDFPIDSDSMGDPSFEGKHQVVLNAWDVLGKPASTVWGNFWIDRSPPAIALSGSLWNGRLVTEPGTALAPSASYNLHIVSTDGVQGGTNAQRRSGVKSVEVRVDGEPVLAPDNVSCPPATTDSCPDVRDYTFSTGEFPAGRHTVEVVATDQLGHQAVQSFDVIVPIAGELLSPQTDSATSRWIQFEAHADSVAFRTVKFQYRRAPLGWQDVPQSAMVDTQGQPVTTINHPLTGGDSPVVHWDVPATWALLGAQPGPIDVRARFSDGTGPGGSSKTVRVTFDPSGLGADNAQEEIGPGTVDLLTGNFSFSETDVALPSPLLEMVFSRTFNSRNPQANPNGPFGPGWVTSIPVSEAAEYANVNEVNDAVNGSYVELITTAGYKAYFFPKASGGYQSETGLESLTLTKPASDRFKLDDAEGNSSLFVHQGGTPANRYDLTQVTQPGTGNAGTITYDASGRVSQVFAPAPPGATCDASSNSSSGCRMLTFVYAATTTATGSAEAGWGDYAGRLKWIEMKAWDASGAITDRPAQFLYDSTGRLRAFWDARYGTTQRKTRYSYDAGGRLIQVTPPGEAAWDLAYQQLPGDADAGRLRSASRSTPQGVATTTVVYEVPVSGLSAPYQMGMSDVDDWSQDDYPTAATAVFPPDQVPASTPTSYSRAIVHYMNRLGREVNEVSPGGSTATSEYDRYGNVVRELSPANRTRALASGSLSAQVADRLDVRRVYQDSGLELVDELGPEHDVKLQNGSVVRARAHTVTVYDEGAPGGTNPHMPTTVTTSAQVVGGPAAADARVMKIEYDWTLLKPTKSIADFGGLNLTSQTTYDPDLGLPTTTTSPRSGAVQHTEYYEVSGSSPCGSVRYHGLVCRTYATASGLSDDLPAPAVDTFAYDRLLNQQSVTSRADGQQITTTNTYGPAGEPVTTRTVGNGSAGGLVLAYGFEETSGTTALDSSGNGRSGSVQGAAVRVAHGRYGRAVKFDGVDDQVLVADQPALDLGDLTLEAWVRSDNLAGTRPVFSRGSTTTGCTGPAYGLRLVGGMPGGGSCGTWYAASAGSSGNPDAVQNVWTHVAVTRQGSSLKVYRDGRQLLSTIASSQANDTAALLIGAGTGGRFSGAIDEVRVYSRALSQAEIDADMRRPVIEGSKHVIPATSGLLAAYGFDEKANSQTLTDGSGNANHGVLRGGARTLAGAAGGALTPQGETVTGNASLEIGNAFTAEAWLAINRENDGCMTLCPFLSGLKVLEGGNFRISYSPSGGSVSTTVDNSAGTRYSLSATLPYSATKASHVAITYDGSTLAIHVDGVLRASRAAIGTLADTDGNLVFGDASLAPMRPLLLDEVKVFDHARTAAQLASDANVPVGDTLEVVTDGEPIADVTTLYDSATGRQTGTTTTESGVTRSLTIGYDALGRVTSYRDADGNVSSTSYDLMGRAMQLDDGKGTQTLGYDPTTGDLIRLVDSHAGTFTATYDADGQVLSQSYPNGMAAETVYDEVGGAVSLTYTKTTNCSADCVWYSEQVQESIHGQRMRRDSSLSDQDFAYDGAGRLTQVADTPTGLGCTTRTYAYDADSNRTSKTTRAPGVGGACDTTSAGTALGSSYDALDRLTQSGVVYDTWGRITTLPASHAGGSNLKTTYYVNDMVRTQTQGAVTKGWLLDPSQIRYRATIPSGTTQEIFHYSDETDSPAWTEVKVNGATQSWERTVTGIDGGLAAVVAGNGSATTATLQISDLHGDVVATASVDPAATALLSTSETDEFGVPKQSGSRTHGFLGGMQRRTVLPSGVIQMGVRSYVPTIGRFTTIDPIPGGSANDYDYASQDPVNVYDLDGRCPWCAAGRAAGRAIWNVGKKAFKGGKSRAVKVRAKAQVYRTAAAMGIVVAGRVTAQMVRAVKWVKNGGAVRIGVHTAHHNFGTKASPVFQPHLQFNYYVRGVKVPKGTNPPIRYAFGTKSATPSNRGFKATLTADGKGKLSVRFKIHQWR